MKTEAEIRAIKDTIDLLSNLTTELDAIKKVLAWVLS